MTPRWTDALLRLTLHGGAVYYLQHRSLTSPEPHYFIVLNVDPSGDAFLVMGIASSKVASVRDRSRNLPLETLVELSPADYPEFTRQSIVDCNHCLRVTRHELLEKLQAGLAAEKTSLSAEMVGRLRQGVLASPVMEAEIKDLLR